VHASFQANGDPVTAADTVPGEGLPYQLDPGTQLAVGQRTRSGLDCDPERGPGGPSGYLQRHRSRSADSERTFVPVGDNLFPLGWRQEADLAYQAVWLPGNRREGGEEMARQPFGRGFAEQRRAVFEHA